MPENNEKDENNNTDPFPQPDMGGKDFPEMDPAGKDPEVISEEEEVEVPEVDMEDIPQAEVAAASTQANAEYAAKIERYKQRQKECKEKAEQAKSNRDTPETLQTKLNTLISAAPKSIAEVFETEITSLAKEKKMQVIEAEKEKYKVTDLKSLLRYIAEKTRILPQHKINENPAVDMAGIAAIVFEKYSAQIEDGVKLVNASYKDNKAKREELQKVYETLEDVTRDQINIHKELTADRDAAYAELRNMVKRRDELLKQKIKNPSDQSIQVQYEQQCINVKARARYAKQLEHTLKDTQTEMQKHKVVYVGTKKKMQLYECVEDVCGECLTHAEIDLETLKELRNDEKGKDSLRVTFQHIAEIIKNGDKIKKIVEPFYKALDGLFKTLTDTSNKLGEYSAAYGMECVGTYAQSRKNAQGDICKDLEKELYDISEDVKI